MSYTINLTNGTTLIPGGLGEGTVDRGHTSLVLIGKDYAGYGQFLNENFVYLLENFANSASPANPLKGQLWWDTANNILRVWSGSSWKISTGATSSPASNPPADLSTLGGDLWYDTTNAQLKVYTGTNWLTVGPQSTPSTGNTGTFPAIMTDTTSGNHVVIQILINGIVYAVISKDTFASIQPGFPVITAGFNFSNAANPAWQLNASGGLTATSIAGSSLTVSGAVTAGSASIGGAVVAAGPVSATTFTGSGSGLVNIPNSALVSNAITISGTVVPLGGSYSLPAPVDTTNASNISSGTLAVSRLPASGVNPGSYSFPALTVDNAGRIIQISNLVPVTLFNNRSGSVTLTAADVTGALTYVPPKPDGTGATGTWNISISGSSASVNNLNAASASLTTATIQGGSISGVSLSATNATLNTPTLVSPNLTGTPTAPTAGSGTNNTQIATTAFVNSAVSAVNSSLSGTISGLGLGSMSRQNSTSVNITGGTISGVTLSGVSGLTAAATSISNPGGWSVVPFGSKLFFQVNGVNVASIDSAGNFIGAQNVSAFGSP
jgi:uncharacterized protein YjbI with pentapeptide repeats